MKRTPTYSTSKLILAAAALALVAVSSLNTVSAQVNGRTQLPAVGRPAGEAGRPDHSDDEVLRVDTQLSRVIVSVNKPGPFVWKVSDNDHTPESLIIDGPERPLQLVVLIDLTDDRDKKAAKHYKRLQMELNALATNLRLQSPPFVIVSSPDTGSLPYGLHWPASWETVYADSLRGALDLSINRLEKGHGNVRRALLFLTNKADELPPNIFEQTDARLTRSAAMIYLVAVKPPKFKGRQKVIARSNINGDGVMIGLFDKDSANYLSTLIASFIDKANTMYVVSYHVPSVEPNAEAIQSPARYAKAEAYSTVTGKLLAWNQRRYIFNPTLANSPRESISANVTATEAAAPQAKGVTTRSSP